MAGITDIKDKSPRLLIYNEAYYTGVFKKTDKIISTVFYIIKDIEGRIKDEEKDIFLESLMNTGREILLGVSNTLPKYSEEVEGALYTLMGKLSYFESLLHSFAAAYSLPRAYIDLVGGEIRSLIKNIDGCTKEFRDMSLYQSEAPVIIKRPRARSAAKTDGGLYEPAVGQIAQEDRRAKILAFLKGKKDVSIRDISDSIKDTSIKSIQRDLKDMMDIGEVVKKGRKRWSVYTLSDSQS